MIVDMLHPALVFFGVLLVFIPPVYSQYFLRTSGLSVLHDAAIIAQDFMDTLYTRCTA